MGDVKQFRSEQSRRNYEKQERRRMQAAKRKEFRAKKQAVIHQAKAWVKANPRRAVAAALGILAVIVMVWLGCKWFVGPGGSIPNFFGHLAGVQEDWLVINTAESGRPPRYHHLADFTLPQGYQRGEFSAIGDDLQQDFYCSAEADRVIANFYISGAKNMTAAGMVEALLSYQVHQEAGEPTDAVIAGKDAHYVYLTFDESDAAGEDMSYSSLCIYMNTDQGACITAMLNSAVLPAGQVPDEATLLTEAETILAGLTIAE